MKKIYLTPELMIVGVKTQQMMVVSQIDVDTTKDYDNETILSRGNTDIWVYEDK